MTPPSSVSVSLVQLSEVIAHGPGDQEPAPGFTANLHGDDVGVTAVLQRMAVVAPLGDRWADKQLVRLRELHVDPAVITWRPKAVSTGFAERRRRRYNAEQREAMRAASDRRTRADQARQAATEAAARPATEPQRTARTALPDACVTTSRPLAAAASQRPLTASSRFARSAADRMLGVISRLLNAS